MEKYVIKGGRPLVGSVEIGGAKNAALGILAAAIMSNETVTIENLPDVNDINALLSAIEGIGATVERVDRHTAKINGSTITNYSLDYDFIKKIRASYYFLGAMLGKYKYAKVPLPGGCAIGERPIDQHIKGFKALGASVDIERIPTVINGQECFEGKITTEAEHLHGAHIFFDVVSVGATINVMMAAALAEGTTVMENAAKEPHIVDVANFLNSMGANIKGAGTDVIRIRGVEKLHSTTYAVIPDQIEAGTFMCAAAITDGDIVVQNVIPKHLECIGSKLIEMGCTIEEYDDAVRVYRRGKLTSANVRTMPYPGFPTDMQPQIAVVMALAEGTGTIYERIFENRFKYIDQLALMGAKARTTDPRHAEITGVEQFTGCTVSSPDLRAGAALVMAGLSAKGYTVVEDIVYIQRGYERFEEKLRALGGEIARVKGDEEVETFKADHPLH